MGGLASSEAVKTCELVHTFSVWWRRLCSRPQFYCAKSGTGQISDGGTHGVRTKICVVPFRKPFMSPALSVVRKAEPLMQLLYCSRRARPSGLDALSDEVDRSGRRFRRLGISATLLAGDGLTMEFMEGPSRALMAHWTALQQDRWASPPLLVMKDVDAPARLFAPRPLAIVFPATPLQMMALVNDVHWHAGHRAHWTMTTRQLATLVDQSACDAGPALEVCNE